MPRLILIRHAEPAATWGDHDDPGLSDLGKQQAAKAAELLMPEYMGAVITSPLLRCKETAEAFESISYMRARIDKTFGEIPTPDGIPDRPAWLRQVLAGDWRDVGAELNRWRNDIATGLLALPQDTVVFSHFVAINAAVGHAVHSREVLCFKPGHASQTELFSDGKTLKLVYTGDESPISLL